MADAKPDELLDRTTEWEWLERLWRSRRPELAFVIGRRRAGKSYLLGRFARAVKGIYYQATKRTEPEQLARLSAMVGEHFGDAALAHGVVFPDWESLFEYVTARAGTGGLLLVLDEFPYLSAAAPALPSILQSLWDHRWPGTRVKVVLSGSHITAMQQLEKADQPLYGRRTGRMDVHPFDYADSSLFLPGSSAQDRLRTYGVFGGLPGHLALLDAGRTFAENVAEHVLTSSGRLVDEAQHLLDAFLSDAQVHYSVIEAIAQGERTWQGMTRRVGREGGSLNRALRWLIEMRIVERAVPITERNPAKSKRALYRLADPYLAFWHRFVSPMVSAGMIGLSTGDELFEKQIAPRLDDHMGGISEGVCRSFVRRSERLPFRPLRVGEWWDASSQNEIDVVALGGNGELLVAECKWGVVHADDVRRLERRVDLITRELTGVRRVHLAVFSGRGIDDDVAVDVEAGRLLHFGAADLFDGLGGSGG